MKKIFTLAAAVLASFSLWAADPDISFEIPASGAAIGDYFKAWEVGSSVVTISGSMGISSNDSHQNISIASNAGNLNANYISIKVTSADLTIDSIALLAGGSGNSKNINAPIIGWETGYAEDEKNAISLNFMEYTTPASGGGKISSAEWRVINTSNKEIKEARIFKKLSKNQVAIEGEDTSVDLGSGETVRIWGMKVWLKENKTIVSTVESLTAVTINDVAISATDLATLVSSKTLFLEDAYVTAPVVKFTKHTVITYDDTSTKEKDEVIEVTSQQALATMWGASATINGTAYSVYTIKAASHTVTYMYGEQVLGTEIVAANGNPAEYAQYETMPLATFGGWYKNAELTQAVDNMAAEVISADATYYAKFAKAYLSQNVNIEQLVLDYGTKYDIKSALTAAGWAYANLNDLDTLNDLENKAARNEPFLGLKMKTTGAYIQGNLKTDGILLVKFGNLGCNINVTLKGSHTDVDETFTKENLWSEDDQAYVLAIYGHAEDVLITISTTGSSTVVLKQLMLDEIAPVTLPAPNAYLITIGEFEHGKVTATWDNKKYRTPVGATVTLTLEPEEGYITTSLTYNGTQLYDNVKGQPITFVMPAADVTINATFEMPNPTAIKNTEAGVKAAKVIRNGQLFIEKSGMLYNAQGAIVK